jgi:hypothetical protein
MLGTGLIKLRGDSLLAGPYISSASLRNPTHSQSLKSLFSLHAFVVPQAGAFYNFLVELIFPWLMVLGHRFQTLAGCLMTIFQGIFIPSDPYLEAAPQRP